MISYLSPFALFVWSTIIFLHLALAAMVRYQSMERRYPWFAVYAYYAAGVNVAMLFVAIFADKIIYRWAEPALSFVGFGLITMVACETYRYVFGPSYSLPRGTPKMVATWLAIALTTAAALTVVGRETRGSIFAQVVVTGELLLTAGACSIFWVLIVCSHSSRIHWPRRTAGIGLGFVLYLTISLITVFVRARATAEIAQGAGNVGQMSYLLSLVWWVWCLKEKEPAPIPASPEQLEQLNHWHERTQKQMRRSGIQV